MPMLFRSITILLRISIVACLVGLSSSRPGYAQGTTWWSMEDGAFAKANSKLAVSDKPSDESTFAWMMFARANQRLETPDGPFSTWERWPSNEETFSPAIAEFQIEKKHRTRPHLQLPKSARLAKGIQFHDLAVPTGQGGEEVTRNMLSYNYIKSKGLDSQNGVKNFLVAGGKADLPIGSVEIKADWALGDTPGAYTFVGKGSNPTYSLLGFHIMTKVAAAPSDSFHSEDPSWFWTTFEFKGNPGLDRAQSLLTYKDTLTTAESMKLLVEAGLDKSNFVNYRCNGSQIRFSDTKNPVILLGNTKMEGFIALPQGPPDQWKTWNTSCHTCHAEASAKSSGSVEFFDMTVLSGAIDDSTISSYTPLDFIWSIPFHAR